MRLEPIFHRVILYAFEAKNISFLRNFHIAEAAKL